MGHTTQEPNALQPRRPPQIGDVLEKMRDARLAEAEMLDGLIAAVGGSRSTPEPVYVALHELAARISFAESTIRSWVASGVLVEGEHYVRKGRRLRFCWPAIEAWLQSRQPQEEPPEVAPFTPARRSRGNR